MKQLLLILLVMVGMATVSCRKCDDPTTRCIDETKIKRDTYCTMEYDPVCGCDGVTYGNSCQADISGVTRWTKGACENDIK